MTTEQTDPTGVGLRSARGPILLSVMLSIGLVAIDATILATAVPAVVEDLGGFTQFPWLFSIYLLAQAISVPIFGKLADLRGRKPVMLLGVGLFVLGSVLCGFAWSMPALIAFRLIQGLGAGAIQPIGMTIIGDIYSVAERARVQGYIASVWGISSFVGPALGGVFADYVSWRWIFFVNIPLGLAAAWVLVRRFQENVDRGTRHQIDYWGTILLAVGGSLLLLGLLEGGVIWAWDSVASVTILAVSVLLLTAFVLVERRAPEPVLPLWVLGHRVLNSANSSALLVGVLMVGLSTYVPLYAQGVLGTSALVAGFALAAMTLGWPIAASLAGRLYLRLGFRTTMLFGAVIVVIGSILLLTVSADSSVLSLALACFVIGLGLGFSASPGVVAAQSSVDWTSRGVVTGANMFARSVGSAVGVAVFGAVANAVVAARLGSNHGDLEHLSGDVLAAAIHDVYLGAAAAAVLLVAAVVFMPNRVAEQPRGPA
ncbi:major facilitator superfamily MFS_1 [Kribbella flavida DSM 17836]|uniref:Major facilitator superfamily MFS_1 n=1 Tax=Kribbella flavida (strain DSM 17836 / JCM 10339 / NBRC 14399) TaxID=479435 RepID=D2PRQ6_KRIFD|nr:MDR family MFS transporter [Kribbella flavida]ADB29236.1 major facilitator superfamily MFS_1 [Kribbella flavida DSM 17836]